MKHILLSLFLMLSAAFYVHTQKILLPNWYDTSIASETYKMGRNKAIINPIRSAETIEVKLKIVDSLLRDIYSKLLYREQIDTIIKGYYNTHQPDCRSEEQKSEWRKLTKKQKRKRIEEIKSYYNSRQSQCGGN